MKTLFLLLLTLSFSAANWQYAVDFSSPASPAQLSCLLNLKYRTVIPRVSAPNGEVDLYGIDTILAGEPLGMGPGSFGYITPNVGLPDGSLQVDKLNSALINSGLGWLSCFIQVTKSSAQWSNDPAANLALINSMINRGAQLGRYFMILTSFSDWVSITGNSKTIAGAYAGRTALWYSNVHGPGVTGESPPNYSDFTSFGPFKADNITMKQFATSEYLCGLLVNRSVFWAKNN